MVMPAKIYLRYKKIYTDLEFSLNDYIEKIENLWNLIDINQNLTISK